MSLTTQFYTMIAMIGMGSYFGAAFDTYSRFLNRTKLKRAYVFINDLLFWLLQALTIFYVLYLVNNGEIRFYIFIALLCGFAAYQSLLKNMYNRLLDQIISISIKTYQFFARVINYAVIKPVLLLVTFIISVILFIARLFYKLLLFIWKIIYRLLKIFIYPFAFIGKILWHPLPQSFKMKLYSTYDMIFAGLKSAVKFFSKKGS